MRALGAMLNLGLRAAVAAVLLDALANPDDHRYRAKGIGTRGMVMIPLSLVVPLLHARRRRAGRGRGYPIWTDNLWLSIFALDLLGNYLDLYDRYKYFDAIPHFHGTGAATVAAAEMFDMPPLSAVGIAQLGHIGLEAQEYYSDVLFDLRNVRGTWDMANDLLAGAFGSALYAAVLGRVRRRSRAPRTGTRA